MAGLREWMVIHPDYWTEAQRHEYLSHSLDALMTGMAPLVKISTPVGAVDVLFMVALRIGQANPGWIPEILAEMTKFAEELEKLMPKETRH